MKILIAPNSFKDSLDAEEVADCIEMGIKRAHPDITIQKLPVSDGGDGLLKRLITATKGTYYKEIITGASGKKVEALYGVLGEKEIAVIESALVCGAQSLKDDEKDVTKTTTYGLGELIKKIAYRGYKSIIIGLGGTVTNDGGAGMMQALGASFLDKTAKEIQFGGINLSKIEKINLKNLEPKIKNLNIFVACNPSSIIGGPEGVSLIYTRQKGATEKQAIELHKALIHFSHKIKEFCSIDTLYTQGAGGGGGIGASLSAFLGARLLPSIELIKKYLFIEEAIKDADIIITGEGRIDARTFRGKIPGEIAKIAKECKKPVISICGQLDSSFPPTTPFDFIYCISNGPNDLITAIARTKEGLKNAGYNIAAMLKIAKGGSIYVT